MKRNIEWAERLFEIGAVTLLILIVASGANNLIEIIDRVVGWF